VHDFPDFECGFDPWLLELADVGFIPDPDEIDAEFGALFRDMARGGDAGQEQRQAFELRSDDRVRDPDVLRPQESAQSDTAIAVDREAGVDCRSGRADSDRLTLGRTAGTRLKPFIDFFKTLGRRLLGERGKRKDEDKEQPNPSKQTPLGPRRPDGPDGLGNEEPSDADIEPLVPWDRGETQPQETDSNLSRQKLDAFAARVGASPERSIQASEAKRETEVGLRE